jgi:transcriptional regulator with XRE-family HTH domain
VRTLVEQLQEAFERSSMTLTELAEKCGIERTILGRKLSGAVPTRTGEAEVIAEVLDAELAWKSPRRRRAARRAA